jgi:hypothetical protein
VLAAYVRAIQLHEVVFDMLRLSAGEREAVYEAVVELVRARLAKVRSVWAMHLI